MAAMLNPFPYQTIEIDTDHVQTGQVYCPGNYPGKGNTFQKIQNTGR